MEKIAVEKLLLKEGCVEIETVSQKPNIYIGPVAYEYALSAYILSGEMNIRVEADTTIYKPGDRFHIPKNQKHSKKFGMNGVTYLIGKIYSLEN